MPAADILVVLPTLGERLESLAETLESIDLQRASVTLTLAFVAPVEADAARRLATKHGAKLIDDPGEGISRAINLGIAARDGERFYAWIGDDDRSDGWPEETDGPPRA